MKIVHFIPTLDFSGQSINMLKVAYGQLLSGHKIKVCGEFIKDFGANVNTYPNLNLFTEWRFSGADYDSLLLNEADIVMYWGPEKTEILEYLSTITSKKIRVVGQIYPAAMSNQYLDIFDAFITFTKLQAEILSYLPTARTSVIGAPIETDLIPVRPRRNRDKFVFGKIGYAGSKMYDKFPQIVNLLSGKIPSVECRIYGSEFSSHQHKWGTFKELDTHLINFVQEECATPVFSQPYRYYQDFDVYIAATSTQVSGEGWSSSNQLGQPAAPIETFCTTALEAMACGVPVIVEEKGCVKEWVRHGIDGFVASTPAEYAKYIQQLYDDIDFYHTMARAARHRATDFELDRIVEKYNKVCLEVVLSNNLTITTADEKIAIVPGRDELIEASLNTDDWFSYPDFYQMVANQDYTTYVEVGVWKGHSISYLANQLKKTDKKDIKIYAVDLFEETYRYKDDENLRAQVPLIYDIYNKNLKNTGTREMIIDVKGVSWEKADKFEDNSIDFVFIDADHEYESVVKDINAWLPKIKKGGMISGDDYFNSGGVKQAVDEIFKNFHYLPEYIDGKVRIYGPCWYVSL